MSTIGARREFTDRLLARLAQDPGPKPLFGDYAAVCTELAHDIWELFPIVLVRTDGQLLELRDSSGGLIAFDSVAERDQALIIPATDLTNPADVRPLCWLPFDGLAALRMRVARLRRDDA